MMSLRARAAAVALLLAACGAQQPASEDSDPCHDSDIAAKRVWNEETKVKVEGQVMQWGGKVGVDVARARAEEVVSSMDRIADDWARMRRAVCKDHFVRKTLTVEAYQRRADCLDQLLARQRIFLSSLQQPSDDASEQISAIGKQLQTCQSGGAE